MEVETSIRAGEVLSDIEPLLDALHQVVLEEAPHLRRLFEIFAQEARVARAWLVPGLSRVRTGDQILEVGAGLMLLSCQLAREGYAVVALEPISEGFSQFSELQGIVLRYAREQGIAPEVLTIPVEDLAVEGAFAFAFSFNVMEHVKSPSLAIRNVCKAIRPGGEYRFSCPNYHFPYEPHFNIPTFFSKKLTEFFLASFIFGSKKMADPAGVWRSLNWINVTRVTHETRLIPDISVSFDRKVFRVALERAINDEEFAARRARWVRVLAKGMVSLGLHRMTEHLPPHVHPIIDCTIVRGLGAGNEQRSAILDP